MISNYLIWIWPPTGQRDLGQELNWPFYPFCGSYDDNHCDDNDDNHYGDNDDDHYEDNEDDNVIEVHRVWLLDH